jgi:dTDP-4-amino-4,6-dideoxygalactose transaminase
MTPRSRISAAQRVRETFLPFNAPLIEDDEINEVIDTLKSGWLTRGPKTRRFEEEFAKYIGAKHAIALNSCTAGLHLALLAAGVAQGDEVITTPYTFASTGEVIIWLGARPVFVDIKEDTFNIAPGKIEQRITPKTKVLLPVHIAGQPCEMDEIMEIAKRHNLVVVEDAAHAISARHKGKMIGTIGDITVFSFYATKNLTTGEGGMVVTDDDEFADKMRILSLHGMSQDAWRRYEAAGSWYYEILEAGHKYNMSDIQASLGMHQLQKIERFRKTREKYAQMYNQAFTGLDQIRPPYVKDDAIHAWHLYIIQLNLERLTINRAEFIEALKAENIGTSVHFIPLHIQPYYRDSYGYKPMDFPRAEHVYNRAISLPLYPKMSEQDVNDVIRAVTRVVKEHSK